MSFALGQRLADQSSAAPVRSVEPPPSPNTFEGVECRPRARCPDRSTCPDGLVRELRVSPRNVFCPSVRRSPRRCRTRACRGRRPCAVDRVRVRLRGRVVARARGVRVCRWGRRNRSHRGTSPRRTSWGPVRSCSPGPARTQPWCPGRRSRPACSRGRCRGRRRLTPLPCGRSACHASRETRVDVARRVLRADAVRAPAAPGRGSTPLGAFDASPGVGSRRSSSG